VLADHNQGDKGRSLYGANARGFGSQPEPTSLKSPETSECTGGFGLPSGLARGLAASRTCGMDGCLDRKSREITSEKYFS